MKSLTTIAMGAVVLAAMGKTSIPMDETIVIEPAAAAAPAQDFDHAKHASPGACTTCHVDVEGGQAYPNQDFCRQCHNDNLLPRVTWTPPERSSPTNLQFNHDTHIGGDQCSTCHVQSGVVQRAVIDQCMACHGLTEHPQGDGSECSTCHVQLPAPTTHEFGWRDNHAVEAVTSPEACATCHIRTDCLDCHRPGAASPAGGFHPADFLTSHPTAAYSQAATCTDCHNTGQFCQDCHRQAGLITGGPGAGVYHDGTGAFTVGHGQAARQSLESCVACHTERDCVRCHVVLNPHGKDFNAERQGETARSACTVCHGGNIPGG